ncbi:hypothetical protein BGZ95_010959 [Linnemannia exigua]|uniref:Uncharacterized protein n=1 Tax=Linnemannia exigua TaxID=604196 RepID=A0AAD4H6S6_9FUNG|nr:hypothetical protein BGZ95_010959 [Linnemannia exigua]
MSKTQFMAFALIAIGLCSRLSLLSKAWAKEYVDCYRLLETWMKTFPRDEARVEEVDYESQLPESVDSVLASSLPEIPDTQLPPTLAHQPAFQSAALEPSVTAAGSDLGEVIQRTQLLPSPLVTAPILPSGSSPRPSSLRKHRRSSRSPSPRPERLQEENSSSSAIATSDPHSNLLEELDTIFGSTQSTSSSSSSNTKKKEVKNLPDLDDIFKSKKKPKSKVKKPSASGTPDISNSASPMSSAPSTPGSGFSTKSKSSTGSKSNFDSIFDFGQGSLGSRAGSGSMPSSPPSGKKVDSPNKVRKDKKEIDDIFGSVKKPKKKSSASEIDSIFGPPKKKKKAP